MPNYQNGKIYELIDLSNNKKYYGSTVQTLKQRKTKHVANYKLYLNKKTNYVSSFEIIKNNNYEIYLIENFPCNSRTELEAREGYYIRNNNCVNKCIVGRTQKEYRQDNKEKIKQYKIDNKEKIKEFNKQYHNDNKEILNLKNKQYSINNKEKIKQYQKQYRINNKEYKKQYRQYVKSWGGNPIYNNNLLKIDLSCFI
tara:strand:+ start:92 stop:685 length:594 start_codon:yes stop_codon:yes gene_type:complete